MGMTVQTSIPTGVGIELVTALRRAMLSAAESTVLPAAIAGAPYEQNPRHGEHLRDTAIARIVPDGAGSEAVMIAFTAFWAAWQHEHLDWHHQVGHAKFLELAMAHFGEVWLAEVADQLKVIFT